MQRQLDLPGTEPPRTEHPDPFANHRQQMGAENSVMRPAILFFQCHLCGQDHNIEHYITLAAKSDEEFTRTLAEAFQKPDNAAHLLTSSAQAWHLAKGDADAQNEAQQAKGKPAYGAILDILITDEQEYTCDDCGATFETMGRLRQHRRRNILTNVSEGVPECRQAEPPAENEAQAGNTPSQPS